MKKNQLLAVFLAAVLCFLLLTVPAFAITQAEVEEHVAVHGKEAVSGNLLIWFLCALAFLKASQKIDSFLGSLGINVGHTGGSILTEIMVAAKGVAMASGGGQHFSAKGGDSVGSAGGGFAGGLAGMVGRKLYSGALNGMTGKGEGLSAGLGRKMFESSLAKGGDFAN